MRYRSEIDGLRAIAVISVILFHAGFGFASGGYVGVDVFFVISGYLITSIIVAEQVKGTFSLLDFYERRARRILPALFVVMLVTLPFSWFWLIPSQLKEFAHSLLSVVTFTSNILFWRESGYWGTVNELKPLLHTWSLAVEEQYYLLFPLFLIAMSRFRTRWMVTTLVSITIVSLIAAQWGAHNKPIANFFLLVTRAWEIAIGALVALYFQYRSQSEHEYIWSKYQDEFLGLIGLLMIGAAILLYDKSTPFPGLHALMPTIGAGLVIAFASPRTLAGRALGTRILVGVGLISYSAYLWHQPLFAFARHASQTQPELMTFAFLSLLTLPIAYLSWKYIESPFRSKKRFDRRSIFIFAVGGSLLFITIGLAGHYTNGFDKRISRQGVSAQQIEKKLMITSGLSTTCNNRIPVPAECLTSESPEIMVWGDSYAMHLIYGLMASNPKANIMQVTMSSCGPFFDVAPVHLPDRPVSWSEECLIFTSKVRELLRHSSTIKYVVLSSPFSQYILKDNSLLFRDGRHTQASLDMVQKEFLNTLDEIRAMGKTPVVFSPPPANGADIGRCLSQSELLGLSMDKCNFRRDEYHAGIIAAYALLDSVKDKHGVIRLDEMICDTAQCKTHQDATYIYRDDGHLSVAGSKLLGMRYDFYQRIIGMRK